VLKLQGSIDHLRLCWLVGESLLEQVSFAEDPEGTRYHVLVALQEMVTNVLRHAYHLDLDRPVELKFVVTPEAFEATLRDQGEPFDPLARAPEPVTVGESIPTQPGGFGIHIVRQIMDELSYARLDGWNELRMKKWAQAPSVVR
jgi:anti-sigma regulatory factor (Ser/Thr protein kinase)